MAEVLRARWRLFCSPGELAVCSSRSSSCHFPPAVIIPPSPFLFLFPSLAHHSISPSFFFRCHTFPCLLSRDNYHYLSSLQGSVCSAEMRSVKGRWESIHSEGKAINTHTHSCAAQISDNWWWRANHKAMGSEPAAEMRALSMTLDRLWNLRGLLNCINNGCILTCYICSCSDGVPSSIAPPFRKRLVSLIFSFSTESIV